MNTTTTQAQQGEELDTFDNMNPVEPEELDTFNNPTPIEAKPDEAKKDTTSQVDCLDDKDETDIGLEKEKEVKDEKEEDKKEEDKKEDKEEEDKEDKKDEEKVASIETEEKPADIKTIKAKSGDKSFDLDINATVPIKVNGKKEFVSIKDLQVNYSGKIAYEDKFNTLKDEKEDLSYEQSKFVDERKEVTDHLAKIGDMLDDAKGDPLSALYYLVDMSGRNVNDYSKRVHDYLSDTVRELDDMDDTERDLYWREKRASYLENNQAAKADFEKQTNDQKERVASIDGLRESHGVSEEQYVDAHEGLLELGYSDNDITPKAVVDYAIIRPHYDKADGLCSEYQEDLSDDQVDMLTETVAKTLRDYPNVSDENAIKISVKLLGWEVNDDTSDLDELASKRKEEEDRARKDTGKKVASKDESGHVESFDDYESYSYGQG